MAVAIRLCRILNIAGFDDSDGTEDFLLLMNRCSITHKITYANVS